MRSLLAVILAAPVLAAPGLAAAQAVMAPYVSLGAGVNLQQNEIVAASPEFGFPNNLGYRFDAGFAGKGSIGLGVGAGFRVEIEGDFLTNHVSGITGTSAPSRAGGYEQKYGGFANVLYDLPLGLPVTPFLGLGVGGQEEALHDVNFSAVREAPAPAPSGSGRKGLERVGGFAYQGIVGFSMPVPSVPGLSLTAEYNFIGLLDPLPAFQRSITRTIIARCAGPVFCIGPKTVTETIGRHFGNNENHAIFLGLRYAFGAPPPPSPTRPSIPPHVIIWDPPYLPIIFFDWDSATLSDRARQIIARTAENSTRMKTQRIQVHGYTDLSGTHAYNLALSRRRAKAVAAECVRDGIPANTITIHGYGDTSPLVPTAPGVREPQNRRVEIIFR